MEYSKNDAESEPSTEIQGVSLPAKITDVEELPWSFGENEAEKGVKGTKPSSHCKKVMKHALRQQAKRRRKNTTIAAGNPAPVQRHTLSPNSCDLEEVTCDTACYRQPTMAEVLASIPGFSMKSRKRSQKKLSAAAQLEQTKEGLVDLETPDSILVHSNLRSLLNKHTFSSLPSLYQYKLLQLLPHVDRTGNDSVFRLSGSGLNNEFFARACLDWKDRLAEGEFTPENQAKIKAEQEREKSKLDPWKLKHFEPTWGESLKEWPTLPVSSSSLAITNSTSASTTAKHHHPKPVKQSPPPPVARVRTIGAVTRAVTSYREKRAAISPPRQLEAKRNRPSDPESENESLVTPQGGAPSDHSKSGSTKGGQELESQTIVSIPPDEALDEPCEDMLDEKTKQEIDYIILPSNIDRISPGKDQSDISEDPHENVSSRTEELVEESLITVSFVTDKDTIKTDYICSKSPLEALRSPLKSHEEEADELHNSELEQSSVIDRVSPGPCERPELSDKPSETLEEYGTVEKSFVTSLANISDIIKENTSQSDQETQLELVSNDISSPNHFSSPAELETKSAPVDNCQHEVNLQQTIDMSGEFEGQTKEVEILNSETFRDLNLQLVQQGMLENKADHIDVLNSSDTNIQVPNNRDLMHVKNNQNEILQQALLHHSQTQPLHHQSDGPQLHQSPHMQPSQLHQPTLMQHQTEQAQLLQQNNQTPLKSHQLGQNQFLQHLDHESFMEQIKQPQVHHQEVNQGQILQGQISQTEALQQHIDHLSHQMDHRANLQQKFEQSGTLPQQVDPLLKSNVLMMPPVVLDMQQIPNTSSSDNSNLGVTLPLKNDESLSNMNAVIAMSSSNEQSLPQLQVVSNPSMTNVPILNDVILPNVSGNRLMSKRPNVAEEKWEVIQVNTEKNDGIYFKEDEAAILAAAWDVVGSSTHFQDLQPPPVSANSLLIPCQEEIELRLQESPLPAPWVDYSVSSDKQTTGHVKLELEVTLTPEVDSQVSSSSAEGGGDGVRVIPPTTIVCLPPLTTSAPPPPPPPPLPASSSAIPYLSLTTSTPVRAVPSKPIQAKSGGRGGRGSNNKPPPGAVNFERSYQICQAVIQNSPNRHQLRCQLKPPPPALMGKKVVTPPAQAPPPVPPQQRQRPRQQTVMFRHMITPKPGGGPIPVSMAVLPSHPSHVGGVRRSNSAPPTNSESQASGGKGRPASVGGPSLSCGGCSLRPLIPCRRCGDFCHEDCITPARLCVTCHSA